ncbi:hypothetical protein V5O48_014820 [Marasmius crinis-equi]|uniref:Uncharacterized protein n=1 Tax=Marasmius crinis-equi TaxID=585013 RepID=A0ABR3EW76_9AGAR
MAPFSNLQAEAAPEISILQPETLLVQLTDQTTSLQPEEESLKYILPAVEEQETFVRRQENPASKDRLDLTHENKKSSIMKQRRMV